MREEAWSYSASWKVTATPGGQVGGVEEVISRLICSILLSYLFLESILRETQPSHDDFKTKTKRADRS